MGKDLTQDLRNTSGPSVDPSTVHWSLIRNGLHGRVTVKKPFLRKGNREKRLSYAKWHKKWTENQWQQVLWREPTSKEKLWNVPQEAWRTTPEDCLKKWRESLSKRVQAVLKNRWDHTKYWLSSLLELYKLCFKSYTQHLAQLTFQSCLIDAVALNRQPTHSYICTYTQHRHSMGRKHETISYSYY